MLGITELIRLKIKHHSLGRASHEIFGLDHIVNTTETASSTKATRPSHAHHTLGDLAPLLRKLPVTLTLEVGSADIALADLAHIHSGSVVELNTLAGEPLMVRVNGTVIGRAEVVVCGESYGLRIVELDNFDFGALVP